MQATNVIYETVIEGGKHWSFRVRRGTLLRVRDVEGGANVGMLFYNPDNLLERYNAPDTLKCQHTFKLTRGHCLYSDMGRIFCAIVEDTFGWHDTVGGNANRALVAARWGERSYQQARNDWTLNGHDSFLVEGGKYGLGRRDLAANVNWFSKVTVAEDGTLAFDAAAARAGSEVVLRFEMDTLVLMHTCPHPMNPALDYPRHPVALTFAQAEPVADDDVCRTSRPENERGFQNNAIYHACGVDVSGARQNSVGRASLPASPDGGQGRPPYQGSSKAAVTVKQSTLDPAAATGRIIVAAGDYWLGRVSAGQSLRIVDLEGNQAVDTLFFSATDPAERYSAVDTIRAQGTLYLGVGSILRSTADTAMLEIVADLVGRHDTIGGACATESNTVRYALEKRTMHACRDSFLLALAENEQFSLTKRDLTHNINFFMNVPVTPDGGLTFADGLSGPGKYVELLALIDVIVLISNCPQLNNPCNAYNPTPIELLVWP